MLQTYFVKPRTKLETQSDYLTLLDYFSLFSLHIKALVIPVWCAQKKKKRCVCVCVGGRGGGETLAVPFRQSLHTRKLVSKQIYYKVYDRFKCALYIYIYIRR